MTVSGAADIRQLSDEQLADVWRAGGIDLAELEAESARRDRAEAARAARRAREIQWAEAMHAQFTAAESYCRGNMLSAAGERARVNPYDGQREPIEPEQLWRVSERDAQRWASEELCNFWLDNPRLTYGAWCRQNSAAADARRARDEADLASMATQPATRAPVTPPRAPERPTVPPTARGSIARYTSALAVLGRQAERTARQLARVNGGIQR